MESAIKWAGKFLAYASLDRKLNGL